MKKRQKAKLPWNGGKPVWNKGKTLKNPINASCSICGIIVEISSGSGAKRNARYRQRMGYPVYCSGKCKKIGFQRNLKAAMNKKENQHQRKLLLQRQSGSQGRVCKTCGSDRWYKDGLHRSGLTKWRCYPCLLRKHSIKRSNRLKTDRTFAREYGWRTNGVVDMTVARYETMYEEQNRSCAICKTPRSRLYVDHDHGTGEVRGLLCPKCNYLAQSLEMVRQVLTYLEFHAEKSKGKATA